MTILFFGDIIGKIGREALRKVLPELRKTFQPDAIIANVENLAHGKGVTDSTYQEMLDMGVDMMTSGNHIWKQQQGVSILARRDSKLLRPANYPPTNPGTGVKTIEIGTKRLSVVNLQGRVFMHEQIDDPFQVIDTILESLPFDGRSAILVDMHAEATSEKVALGWYLDGRVSVVVGTHTHVPTADAWIMPGGTGYITDVGMTGSRDSVIGVEKQAIIRSFKTSVPVAHEIPEHGDVTVNALVVEIDTSGKTKAIQLHQQVTNV